MPVFHDSALIGAAGASGAGAGGYQISRSLRFNSADSAYLSRTPGSAGNRKTWTWAGWVKRGKLGSTNYHLFSAKDGSNDLRLYFFNNDTIEFTTWNGSSAAGGLRKTTQVFRDPSAWYHIVLAYDTTQATAADRIKLYVNGSQVTAFSSTSDPSQNLDWIVNNTIAHQIGAYNTTEFHDGLLADIHLIDGQALTPSSFAETDATTGQWVPKAFSGGSYGTNGFRLTFSDNSGTTATTLGKDAAGSNNFTPTNFSVSSGAGNDSLVDTPTSYGTDTGAGGEVRGNYATLNAVAGTGTLANGNLDFTSTGAAFRSSTIGVNSGKWYWEVLIGSTPTNTYVGIYSNPNDGLASNVITGTGGNRFTSAGGAFSVASSTFQTNDIFGVAADLDAGTVTWYRNGSVAVTLTGATLNTATWYPGTNVNAAASTAIVYNFGQRPFAYTAPSGFKALCDTNLPAPTIAKPSTVMDVVVYTGNSTDNRAITGLGFSPDLVWFGPRSQSGQDKVICDSVRGVQKALFSNQTYVEADPALYGSVGIFDSAGFTIKKGTDATFGFHQVNLNSSTYAAWCWDAGTTTSSNGSGFITSSVRANASAGFSIVTYTGTGANATVGHGLGVAAQMVIVKRRNSTGNWAVWHKALAGADYLRLNSNAAKGTDSTYWNSTVPTGTVFSVGTSADTNTNGGTYVAYCFASVSGYSLIGDYQSGTEPFVFCGFRPRYILIKRTASSDGWAIFDTSRTSYNVATARLEADASTAEGGSDGIDILSNGFKIKTTWGGMGGSLGSGTMAFMAFAENPFQYARAR